VLCLLYKSQGCVQALTEVLEAQAKHFSMCFKYQALFQAFEEKSAQALTHALQKCVEVLNYVFFFKLVFK